MTFRTGYKEVRVLNGVQRTVELFVIRPEGYDPQKEYEKCRQFVLGRFAELEKGLALEFSY